MSERRELVIGPAAGRDKRSWIANVEAPGRPRQMVPDVHSHAEAIERQRATACDRLVIPDDVLREMARASNPWLQGYSWHLDERSVYHLVPDAGQHGVPAGETLCRDRLYDFPELDGGVVAPRYKAADELNNGQNPDVDRSCARCLQRRGEMLAAEG